MSGDQLNKSNREEDEHKRKEYPEEVLATNVRDEDKTQCLSSYAR